MTDLPPPVLIGHPLNVRLIHTAAWIIVIQAILSLTLILLSVALPALFLALGSS